MQCPSSPRLADNLNLFRQLGSHAERLAQEIRQASGSIQGWVFLGSCVELDGPLINYITDARRRQQISPDAFWGDLGQDVADGVNSAHGYDVMGWDIREDPQVTCWRSFLPSDHPEHPGRLVIFYTHSRIEYTWIKERS
jgi:hypothetical protein